MLKLLLSHWQAHREPLPFVLTDDPLYCSHLTAGPFPEVYSVNRVNPIFEEDEEKNKDDRATPRSPSENETRAGSDDTGYSSGDRLKSFSTTDDAGSLRVRPMSSDSDDTSPIVVVAAEVHRVSRPDDVIVLTASSDNSSLSANSLSSRFGSESLLSSHPEEQSFFDSLTMSSYSSDPPHGDASSQTEVKRPLRQASNGELREKLKKLLEKGNEVQPPADAKLHADSDIARTKNDLMKSLTRALNQKVPKVESDVTNRHEVVTRSDSALLLGDSPAASQHFPKEHSANKSSSVATKPKLAPIATQGVTRQDESTTSSASGSSKRHRKHIRPAKHGHDSKRNSSETQNSDSASHQKSGGGHHHKCKLCENANRPMAFHQLLPGHWSYDNVYLPQQMSGALCYHCHHHDPRVLSSSDDSSLFYRRADMAAGRARHSWAPYTSGKLLPDIGESGGSKGDSGQTSSGTRYSPDGTSQDVTDSSLTDSGRMRRLLQERLSLRAPKKCKCEECLAAAFDPDAAFPGHHDCPCYCLSHRKVKFASDSDVSQPRHHHPLFHGVFHLDKGKLGKGQPINAAFVMNLPHLNGSALSKSQGAKENGFKSGKGPSLVPRGLKEPVKMDELYRTYPINFRDWEAHYRRTYLKKRKKRALTMVGMAIGIILVVGVAVALTFIFLRIKKTS